MVIPKKAHVDRIRELHSDIRLLDLVMLDDASLGFEGGQYIIVDSGLTFPNGKPAKRAYSILSGDGEQNNFQIAVKKIPHGFASQYLHEVREGDEITFSGPWGKFKLENPITPIWVIATDTGITAALGLLKGRDLPANLPIVLSYFSESENYFLPPFFLEEALSTKNVELEYKNISPIDNPKRISQVQQAIKEKWSGAPEQQLFLAGDGDVIFPLQELAKQKVSEDRITLECFFNNPRKKLI